MLLRLRVRLQSKLFKARDVRLSRDISCGLKWGVTGSVRRLCSGAIFCQRPSQEPEIEHDIDGGERDEDESDASQIAAMAGAVTLPVQPLELPPRTPRRQQGGLPQEPCHDFCVGYATSSARPA